MDPFGDALPDGALARLGTMRFRHPSIVTAIAISSDGSLLASGDIEGVVRVWEMARGALVASFDSGDFVTALSFSSDGDRLFVAVAGRIDVRDTTAWASRGRLDGVHHTAALAVSPDGRLVAAAEEEPEYAVRVWDAGTGGAGRALGRHDGGAATLAFSVDGGALLLSHGAMDGDNVVWAGVRSWQISTGAQTDVRPKEKVSAWNSAFTPDRTRVLLCGRHVVRVRDARTGETVCEVPVPDEYVHVAQLSPNGQVLGTGGTDKLLSLWQFPSGRPILTKRGPTRGITALAFSPEGRAVVSCGLEPLVRVWDLPEGRPVLQDEGHARRPAIAWSPDGSTIATAVEDVRLWDPKSGREARRMVDPNRRAVAVAYSPDGETIFVGMMDGSIRLREAATGREVASLRRHERPVASIACGPDGVGLISTDSDGILVVGEIGAAGLQTHRALGSGPDLVVSGDGALLATAGGANRIAYWQRDRVGSMDTGEFLIASIALLPEGRTLAAGSREGPLLLIDVSTWTVRKTWNGHEGVVVAVVAAPDGQFLASASEDGTVRIWEEATGAEVRQIRGPGRPCALAYSPDGRALATGWTDTTTLLWDTLPATEGARDLNAAWAELGGNDGARAYEAICAFAAGGDAAAIDLARRLRDEERLRILAERLDDDDPDSREEASSEMDGLQVTSRDVIRGILDRTESAEARARLERILQSKGDDAAPLSRVARRTLRAICALERIGSRAATETLELLARDGEGRREGRAASAAIARLVRRR